MNTIEIPIANSAAARWPSHEIHTLGEFTEPSDARAIVLFAHGSGSARHSDHDRFLSNYLNRHGYGTVLLDVLTPLEEAADIQTGVYRYNVQLVAHRVTAAIDKVANFYEPELPVAIVGVGTGAAAALIAASRRPATVRAVVSRGGYPHLAGPELCWVKAPTLLLVGSDEHEDGIKSNQSADLRLECTHELLVVPGASHCFEGTGAIENAARQTLQWLDRHVAAVRK